MGEEIRTCNTCGTTGPLENFHRHRATKGGRRRICKFCATAKVIEYAALNPEKVKLSQRKCRLKKRYGLTLDQFEEILSAQGNACAICQASLEDYFENPPIDHCHATGRVRGILCCKCNGALGWFERHRGTILAYIE